MRYLIALALMLCGCPPWPVPPDQGDQGHSHGAVDAAGLDQAGVPLWDDPQRRWEETSAWEL